MDTNAEFKSLDFLDLTQNNTQHNLREKLNKARLSGAFFVKKRFCDSNGIEFMWCEVIAIDEDASVVEAILSNTPSVVSHVARNDHVTVRFEDIIEILSVELGLIL